MKRERNNKHFIIYYKKGTGTFVITEPKPWARENRHYFPDNNFTSDSNMEPRTREINKLLIENFKFLRQDFDENNITVLFNLDPNIEI